MPVRQSNKKNLSGRLQPQVLLICCAEASSRDAPSIELPHQHAEEVGHIALDIGGSLIKLLYFSSADSGASSEAMTGLKSTAHEPQTGGQP